MLDEIASRILYENFPLFDPEKQMEISYLPHDVRGYLIPTLSPRNAVFVKHLVFDTVTFTMWNAIIRNAIAHCHSLQVLTLYLLGSWEEGYLNKFRDMPIFSVTELSLRIICSPDEGWLDNLLPMFRNLVTLRVAVLDHYPSVLLFRQISQASNVQHLEVNLFPKDGEEYGLLAELFPTVKSVTLAETHFREHRSCAVFHDPTPSPYRGHTITPSALSTIISIEQSHTWEIKIPVTHLILQHFEDLLLPPLEWSDLCKNATSPFHEWAQNHGIKIIPDCRTIELPYFESQDTEVFLNLRCPTNRAFYNDSHIQHFLSRIVPNTRSLIINTHVGSSIDHWAYDLSSFQSEALENFFSEVVRQKPNFQLQHIQNFPTLDEDTTKRVSTMDARAIAPLAALHSLTSIDLDFYYLSISPS